MKHKEDNAVLSLCFEGEKGEKKLANINFKKSADVSLILFGYILVIKYSNKCGFNKTRKS